MSHHYIQFSNVHYSYPDGHEVLKGVTFRVTHGEKVALLGLNGAGKTTLLLHTNGLLLPTKGEVNIGDVPVTKKTLKLVRQSVGMVFQNPDDQLFMPTLEDDVAFGPRNMGLPEEEVQRRVTEALAAVGAEQLRHLAPWQMSGGQRRAAALATVLSMGPSILVLDEPTSALDAAARRRVIDLLASFSHTILVVTHDLEMAADLCPRSLLMADGRIIADEPTTQLLLDDEKMGEAGLEINPSLREYLDSLSKKKKQATELLTGLSGL